VREEEERRRERDEADESSARPDRERGRQGSYPAASSLHRPEFYGAIPLSGA
jgi:hypothetical protein